MTRDVERLLKSKAWGPLQVKTTHLLGRYRALERLSAYGRTDRMAAQLEVGTISPLLYVQKVKSLVDRENSIFLYSKS